MPPTDNPPVFNPSAPAVFPVAQLESRLSSSVASMKPQKKKRPPIKDLAAECPLHELPQYVCDVMTRRKEGSGRVERIVECREVLRLFRRCPGGLTVETTAWEGFEAAGPQK